MSSTFAGSSDVGLAQLWGVAINGVIGIPIRVEVDVSGGLPSIGIVGLPDASIGESRWRARSAILNSELAWPGTRITIGLSPADVPKHGSGLDLAIAVGILTASEQLQAGAIADSTFVGELGLDGAVRSVRGALVAAVAASRHGLARVFVSCADAPAAALVDGIEVLAVRDLAHLVGVLTGAMTPEPIRDPPAPDRGAEPDLAEVRGHAAARFALEVAATGAHHLAMTGPPGVGKTLIARMLPGLLPDLDAALSQEVSGIHAVAEGCLQPVLRPPFQSPHHTASAAALLGSVRAGRVWPGAVTLAHGGVLFLDEAPEFARPSLEGLRQPLESGRIAINRAHRAGVLPARFQFVIASNPCPCGMAVDQGLACTCTPTARRRYSARISGPLLDRVDIRLAMRRPAAAELAGAPGEASATVAERVALARARAARRFADAGYRVNAHIAARDLRTRWLPDEGAAALLREAERSGSSLRGSDRVLRLAWSIADLAGAPRPARDHMAAALALRGGEQ